MLSDVLDTFRKWLYLPDPAPLYAALATAAANRFEGRDPLWLALVGPPGCGKSEIVQSLYGLEDVHPIATMTEAALLSGTRKADKSKDATGGVLAKIGKGPGIIACKDFGSILNMNQEEKKHVLAALREIYDGSWDRALGVDGGRTLHWEGKVGLIAGVTGTIDRHHAAMAAMGERLVLLRMPKVDPILQGTRAFEIGGSEDFMRGELRACVTEFFQATYAEPEPTSQAQGLELVHLSALVAQCRSSVERDNYTREIELIPDSEAPTRLVGELDRLFCGLRAIGCVSAEAWAITVRCGLDCLPMLRRLALDAMLDLEDRTLGRTFSLADIAIELQYPESTVRRCLDDLAGHHVTIRVSSQGKKASYELNPRLADQLRGLRADMRVAA